MAKFHVADDLSAAIERFRTENGIKTGGQAVSQMLRLFLAGKQPSNPTSTSVPAKQNQPSISHIDDSNLSSLSDLL